MTTSGEYHYQLAYAEKVLLRSNTTINRVAKRQAQSPAADCDGGYTRTTTQRGDELKKDFKMKAITWMIAMLSFTLTARADMLNIDGNQIEYELTGNGNTIVLFDAGALTGMAGWDSIWNDLPKDITAIRFSRLGEGHSDACEGQRSEQAHVDEVSQVLAALEIDQPFIYVGHSLGGATARNYAARYPDKVLGMLLVDPENPRDVDIIRDIDPVEGPRQIAEVKAKDYELSAGRWCFLDAVWEKNPAKGAKEIGDIPVTLIASVRRSENPQTIFRSDEGRRRWGDIQREWVVAFPRGKYVSTTKSGHYIQKDEPGLVLSELRLLTQRVAKQPNIAR